MRFLALLLSLTACFSQSETLTPSDPSDVADPSTVGEITFTVSFDGDTVVWPMATVTCGEDTFSAAFDDEGWAELVADCDGTPYFNLVDNDDPNVLAEIIDNGDDTLVPVSHLEVFEGEYNMVLYPVTVNHDVGGRFSLCDVPQWDVDSGGMPYGPLEAWGEDLCSV